MPDDLRANLKSSVLVRHKDAAVVRRFIEHQNSLAKCAGNDCEQTKNGLQQVLGILYSETHGLKNPKLLIDASLDLQKRRGWKPQTMLNYLAAFSNFVDYCYLYNDGVSPSMQNEQLNMKTAIKTARKAYSTAAVKDYRGVAQEMRAKVPSPALVRSRFRSIFDLLKENLQNKKSMSYKVQQAFNFFILQVRLNTRSGPLLQLTWEEFGIIDKTNKCLQTDRHKTGKHSAVNLFIQPDQRPLLRNMREKFIEENLIEPVFVFASKK